MSSQQSQQTSSHHTLRNFMFGVIVTTGTFVICAAVIEAAFRLSYGEPLLRFPNFLEDRIALVKRFSGPLAYDAVLGWRLSDNYEAPGTFRFSTGPMGLRLNGTPIGPSMQGAVVAVGDSFTAGSGVQDHETWPAVLEDLWRQPVYNGASGGWGVDQIVLRAEELADKLAPKVIIVGILAQDSLRNSYEIYGVGFKPFFRLRSDGIELTGVPVPRIGQRSLALGSWRRILGYSFVIDWGLMRLGFGPWWVSDDLSYKRIAPDEAGVEVSCRLMDRLAKLRDQYRARILVVMQYGASEAESTPPPWYGPPVVACAQARGFDTVDTHRPLHALAQTDRQRFVSLWLNEGGQLGHMSVAGNAFIANLIAESFDPSRSVEADQEATVTPHVAKQSTSNGSALVTPDAQ